MEAEEEGGDAMIGNALHIPDDGPVTDDRTETARPEYIATWYVAGYIGRQMLGALKGQSCHKCKNSVCTDRLREFHTYMGV